MQRPGQAHRKSHALVTRKAAKKNAAIKLNAAKASEAFVPSRGEYTLMFSSRSTSSCSFSLASASMSCLIFLSRASNCCCTEERESRHMGLFTPAYYSCRHRPGFVPRKELYTSRFLPTPPCAASHSKSKNPEGRASHRKIKSQQRVRSVLQKEQESASPLPERARDCENPHTPRHHWPWQPHPCRRQEPARPRLRIACPPAAPQRGQKLGFSLSPCTVARHRE